MKRGVIILCLLSAAVWASAYIDPELVKENLRKARESAAVELVLRISSVEKRKNTADRGGSDHCATAKVVSVKMNEKFASIGGKKGLRRKGETVSFRVNCHASGELPAPGEIYMGECSAVKPGRSVKVWSRNADFPSRSGGDCQGADLGMEFYDEGEVKMEKGVYDFTVKDSHGEDYPLSGLKGRVTLIVNVASNCGFTPQYEGLEELYKKYGEKGLTVIGFPCNQFGGQEPGTNTEIQKFCSLNYGVTFPVLGKLEVNGKGADPLYVHLKSTAPGLLGSEAIKWNFTKFLVDREGRVTGRYAPQVKPAAIAPDIEKALGLKAK